MKSLFSVILFFFISGFAIAQNLVPNPGFEEFFSCPEAVNGSKTNKKIAPHWNSVSYGTPDLYNKCSRQMGLNNPAGFTDPYSGDGFAGVIVWEKMNGFREYLQVQLTEPLKAGSVYVISFYYKLSSYSIYSADRICFVLSDKSSFYKQDTRIPIEATYCRIKPEAMDPYTGEWELLETEYTAKGGEEFLTIGNFSDNSSTKTTHLYFKSIREPMLQHAAYYYLDEVSVSEKRARDTTYVEGNWSNEQEVRLEDTYVLENVLFNHNSDSLLPESFKELDEVIEILKKHPDWKIRISGHTDATGSAAYNQTLSEKRAESVKRYLLSGRIKEERIQAKGYGQSKPLDTGGDDSSSEKNRRVEVEFY